MSTRFPLHTIAAALLIILLSFSPSHAGYVYDVGSGSSQTVYGVADYGLPVQVFPQWILNDFNGLDDVLISPGGGFLTADTSVPNNIADTGVVGLPYLSGWIGGGNANGVFGAGQTLLTPNLVAFNLTDANPDGAGAASYLIGTLEASFTEDLTGFGGAAFIDVGIYLALTGAFSSPLSAGAVGLSVYVESLNPGSPFFGGKFYDTVLAAAAIGNFNSVAYAAVNGIIQPTAVMLNNGVNPFFGLAIASESLPTAGMIGDTITVKATLTAIADPMFMGSLLPPPPLVTASGGSLPTLTLFGTTAVPEPSALCLVAIGFVGLLGSGAWCRNRSRGVV